MSESKKIEAKIIIQSFLQKLENAIKRFVIEDWIEILSVYLKRAPIEVEKIQRHFQAHCMLHSIEYLCVVGRNKIIRKPTNKDIQKISRIYFDMENNDPFGFYLLRESKDEEGGLIQYLTDLSYKTFIYQGLISPHEISRTLFIFADYGFLKKSEVKFENKYGLNYYNWICLTIFLFSVFNNEPIFSADLPKIKKSLADTAKVSPEAVQKFLEFLYLYPEEIKRQYYEIRKKTGAVYERNLPSILELHIPSIFQRKPIIRKRDKIYITMSSLIPMASFNNLLSINQKISKEFSDEFGSAFEKYVVYLLDKIKHETIVKESFLKKIIGLDDRQKLCDVVFEDSGAILDCTHLARHKRVKIST